MIRVVRQLIAINLSTIKCARIGVAFVRSHFVAVWSVLLVRHGILSDVFEHHDRFIVIVPIFELLPSFMMVDQPCILYS